MAWKARTCGSFVSAAAYTLFALASPLGRAQVPPTSGAGVLLGMDAYGHSAASPRIEVDPDGPPPPAATPEFPRRIQTPTPG